MKKFFDFSFGLLIIYLNTESLMGFQLCTFHKDYSDRCLLGFIYDNWEGKFDIDVFWFTFKI